MNEKKPFYEGEISKKYAPKETIKTWIILTIIFTGTLFMVWMITYWVSIDEGFPYPILILTAVTVIVLFVYALILLLSYLYYKSYVKNFAFEIHEENIIIFHGVFTKVKATIPYSRVQNINITNGIFDRMFNIYTAKIETAGSSAAAQSAQGGVIRPEGYIPALEDPDIVEKKMKEMITKYSGIPSGLEDKVFKPEELAFDNFISYIMSKMREGEKLKTSIRELREKSGMSISELAEKVGVPKNTIEYLEEGKYNPSLTLAYKVAEALNTRIEDLFRVSN
jgi:putative transcriptional regulator